MAQACRDFRCTQRNASRSRCACSYSSHRQLHAINSVLPTGPPAVPPGLLVPRSVSIPAMISITFIHHLGCLLLRLLNWVRKSA